VIKTLKRLNQTCNTSLTFACVIIHRTPSNLYCPHRLRNLLVADHSDDADMLVGSAVPLALSPPLPLMEVDVLFGDEGSPSDVVMFRTWLGVVIGSNGRRSVSFSKGSVQANVAAPVGNAFASASNA
jgi:hypothetical protein